MPQSKRKKIGVIMPAITETLDTLYLDGICRQLHPAGYDVIVFTCCSNTQSETTETAYVLGEESIYQLAPKITLDGMIFAGGKFHDRQVAERILHELRSIRFPCVCTDFDNDYFPSVRISQFESARKITEHLIHDHGLRDIFCLTGPQGSPDAEERLAGWRMAMETAGLPVSQYCYGDFWRIKAAELADEFAEGKRLLPEAVVCMSDIMAIALCRQLAVHGIRVPEDVAVTGFDGGPNANLNNPTITTIDGKEFELGTNAALRLLTELDGQARENVHTQFISLGKSCGCRERGSNEYLEKVYEKFLLTSEFREQRMMSDYINKMASSDSMTQLGDRIHALTYVFPYWNDVYVCIQPLPEDAAAAEDAVPVPDFADTMQLFVSCHHNRPSDDDMQFSTASFLPDTVISDEPQLMIATPLHNAETCYGYLVTTYSDPRQYVFDDLYVGWRDSIANALSVQYIKAQNRFLNQRLEKYSQRDRMTGMLNLKGLAAKLLPQHYACILIELQWIQTPANSVSMTPDLFLANALRMNCTESELCFRYNKDVFGVLIPLPDKLDASRVCEEWTMRFDEFIDLVRKRDRYLEKPVIRFYYHTLEQEMPLNHEELEIIIKMRLREQKTPSVVKGSYVQQFEELRRQIVRKPSEDWTQDSIAAMMQISASYFRRIYKQHFGTSFHADLIHIRMSHAMKLLRQTDMNIKVISGQCGYANMYHFMTAFKKETGMTPTEFRKAERQK